MLFKYEKVYEDLDREAAAAVLSSSGNHKFKCTICGKTHYANSNVWQKCSALYREKLFDKIFGFVSTTDYYNCIDVSFKMPIINMQTAMQNEYKLKQMAEDLFALFSNINRDVYGAKIRFSRDMNLAYFFLPYTDLNMDYRYIYLTVPVDLFAEAQKEMLSASFNSSLGYIKSVIEKYSQIMNKYCLLFDCSSCRRIKDNPQKILDKFRAIIGKIYQDIKHENNIIDKVISLHFCTVADVIKGIKQKIYESAYNYFIFTQQYIVSQVVQTTYADYYNDCLQLNENVLRLDSCYTPPVQNFSVPRIPQQNFPDISINCHEYRAGNQFIDAMVSKAWEYLLPIREKMVDSFLASM